MLRPPFATPRRALRAPLLPLLLLALGGRAQEPLTPPQLVDADWLAPIHGLGNDPLADEYGLWASGPDYKISFGRSVAFFPLRGEAGENMPLRWTTRSVRVGGKELLNASAEAYAEHSDWRYVLHHGALDERYDVRREGVEQSFVLHAKPAHSGDLVIEGALETALVPSASEPAHRPLEFHLADGTPLVTYGSALAIDAAGRTTPVLTSIANGAIRLQLEGAWIAEASFPLVVDPLLSSRTVVGDVYAPGTVDIAADDENHMFLIGRERLFAIGDYDLRSSVVSANGALLSGAFSDTSNAWSTQHPSAAYVAGDDKWVLAFERISPLTATARVYAYIQDDGPVAPAGVVRQISRPAGTQQRYPVVGGVLAWSFGEQALIVFQEDTTPGLTDTDESRIRGALLDTNLQTFGSSFAISIDSPGHDCERPSVSRSIGSTWDSWLVVYQQFNAANAADDWDAIGRLVRGDGQLSGREIVAAALPGEHVLRPQVDGVEGRFLIFHGAIANTQKSYGETFPTLRAQRVDWEFFGAGPSFPSPRRLLRSAASNLYGFGRAGSHPIAYNRSSQSHWGLGWIEGGRIARAMRVGYDAGIVENAILYQQGSDAVRSVSAGYDETTDAFAFAFGVADVAGNNPVVKRDLVFANAAQLPYGSTCQGTALALGPITGSSAPHAGSEFFYLALDAGAPFAPTALLISPLPGMLPLGNGCTLYLDPASFFLVWSGMSNAAGELNLQLPLPTTPFYEYDLYWQWLQIDPMSGQPTLTNLLRTVVR
ncbi:MAG: hypothetical protein JNM84_02970 [Planctomycetes bacterium]|nr:hypothetical protein [Planctomycetota bacterium]